MVAQTRPLYSNHRLLKYDSCCCLTCPSLLCYQVWMFPTFMGIKLQRKRMANFNFHAGGVKIFRTSVSASFSLHIVQRKVKYFVFSFKRKLFALSPSVYFYNTNINTNFNVKLFVKTHSRTFLKIPANNLLLAKTYYIWLLGTAIINLPYSPFRLLDVAALLDSVVK